MQALGRSAGLLLVFICVMSLTVSHSVMSPPPAQAAIIPSIPGLPSPCDLIPDATARKICKVATDPVSAANDAIGLIPGIPKPSQIVNAAVSAVGNAVLQPILLALTKAEADAVGTALQDQAKIVNSTTSPDLTARWFGKQYAIVYGFALMIAVVAFFLNSGSAATNQDIAGMGRGVRELMLILVIGGFLPGIVGLTVQWLDNTVAPGFMAEAGASATEILNRLPAEINDSISGVNGAVGAILFPLIVLFFGVIASVLLALMFFFREGMLYLVTASTIIAWGLSVGGRSSKDLLRNNVLMLTTLAFFKVIAAFIFVIGLGLFGSQEGAQPVILGTVILLLLPVILWGVYQSRHNIRFVPIDILSNQIRRRAASLSA